MEAPSFQANMDILLKCYQIFSYGKIITVPK